MYVSGGYLVSGGRGRGRVMIVGMVNLRYFWILCAGVNFYICVVCGMCFGSCWCVCDVVDEVCECFVCVC